MWEGPRGWGFLSSLSIIVVAHSSFASSLEACFNACDRKFSLKTTLLLADQVSAAGSGGCCAGLGIELGVLLFSPF